MRSAATLDADVRRHVYDVTLASGRLPTIEALADATVADEASVRASLSRLAAGRIVVLQRESGEILMAPPFSAVPTLFPVHSTRHTCWANCAWDALGVAAMMRATVDISSACGCCGEALTLRAGPDRAPTGDCLLHFAVPARHWWDDIVFT
jgi:hypothetical protein